MIFVQFPDAVLAIDAILNYREDSDTLDVRLAGDTEFTTVEKWRCTGDLMANDICGPRESRGMLALGNFPYGRLAS